MNSYSSGTIDSVSTEEPSDLRTKRILQLRNGKALVGVVLLRLILLPMDASLAVQAAPAKLRGTLLVATWQINDPRFSRTVVYMIEHSDGGAMGLILNRVAKKISFAELFKNSEVEAPETDRELLIRFGGPVEMNRSFLLHSTDLMLKNSHQVAEGIAVTGDLSVLEAIAEGEGPTNYVFVMGYAGWAPQQLEAEIKRGDWRVIEAEPTVVFMDPEKIWERVNEDHVFRL
jgi:putative transcriptional regulator